MYKRQAHESAPGEAEADEEGGAAGLWRAGAGAHFRARLHAPRLWTAETPFLYTLVVVLRDRSGEVVDVEACWVGLREVHVRGGLLKLNGMPLTLRGVNRHEHCPEKGKAVDGDTMLADALLMKRHSLNAMRASHYPTDTCLLYTSPSPRD